MKNNNFINSLYSIIIILALAPSFSAYSSNFEPKKCTAGKSLDTSILQEHTQDVYNFISNRVDFDNHVESGKGCDSEDRELNICVYNFAKAAKFSDIKNYWKTIDEGFLKNINLASNGLVDLYYYRSYILFTYKIISENFNQISNDIEELLNQFGSFEYYDSSTPLEQLQKDIQSLQGKNKFNEQDRKKLVTYRDKVYKIMALLPLKKNYNEAEYDKVDDKLTSIKESAEKISYSYYSFDKAISELESRLQQEFWHIKQLMDWIERNLLDWLNIYNEHNLSAANITNPNQFHKDIVETYATPLQDAQTYVSSAANTFKTSYYFSPVPLIWEKTILSNIETLFQDVKTVGSLKNLTKNKITGIYSIENSNIANYLKDKDDLLKKLADYVNNNQNAGAITLNQVKTLANWYQKETEIRNKNDSYFTIINTLKLYNGSFSDVTKGVDISDWQKIDDYLKSLESKSVVLKKGYVVPDSRIKEFLNKADKLLSKYIEIETKLREYKSEVLDNVASKSELETGLNNFKTNITNKIDLIDLKNKVAELSSSLHSYDSNLKNLEPCDKILLREDEGIKLFERSIGLSSNWYGDIFGSIYLKTRLDTDNSKICLDFPSPSGNLPISCKGLETAPLENDIKFCAASAVCLGNSKLNNHYLPSITGRIAVCLQSTLQKFFTGEKLCDNAKKSTGSRLNFFTVFQQKLRNIIFICLTLYVVLFSLKSVIDINSGREEEVLKLENLFWFIMKAVLVIYFAVGYEEAYEDNSLSQADRHEAVITEMDQSMHKSGMTELVMPLVTKGPFIFADWAVRAFQNQNFCNFGDKEYPPSWAMMRFWDSLDCRITHYLGISYYQQALLNGTISDNPEDDEIILSSFSDFKLNFPIFDFALKMFTGFYIVHFLLLVPAYYMLLIMILTMSTKLITYIIVMYILIYISPIIIPMVLFDYTKRFYDQWIKLMMSFFLQPMVIAPFLYMILTIFDSLFFSGQCEAIEKTIEDPNGHTTVSYVFEQTSGESSNGVLSGIKCKNSLGAILGDYLQNRSNTVLAILLAFDQLNLSQDVEDDLLLQLSVLLLFSFIGFNFIQMVDQFAAKITGGIGIDSISRDMSAEVPKYSGKSGGEEENGNKQGEGEGEGEENGANRDGGKQSSDENSGGGDKSSGGSEGDSGGDKASR
jgi:type IV secretion system protein VirB6